jgi:hypothetical protein
MKSDGSNFMILHHFNEVVGLEGHITIHHNVIYGSSIGASFDGGFLFSIHTDGSNYNRVIDFPTGDCGYPTGRLFLLDEQFNPGQNTSLARTSVASGGLGNSVSDDLSKVKLFPNPSSKSFTISIPKSAEHSVELMLYDVNGAIISSFENSSGDDFQIGEDLSPGVYILSVKMNHGKSISKHKLIKK